MARAFTHMIRPWADWTSSGVILFSFACVTSESRALSARILASSNFVTASDQFLFWYASSPRA
jgi:hypothetical protein